MTQGVLTAVDPNLTPFADRGGKLLIYHGWAEQNIPPRASVNFYKRRARPRRPCAKADWVRLFMVPGMGHCGGGDGPNTFDTIAALESWVERGQAPASILASQAPTGRWIARGRSARTRRWRSTKAPAASTTPQILPVSQRKNAKKTSV